MGSFTDTLRWPAHFPPTGRKERFFIGVRWLGPDLSFFKALRQLQIQRDERSLLAWPEGEQRDAAIVIGGALQMQVRWPKPYFLPGDRLNTVVYGPRFQTIDDLGWYTGLSAAAAELRREVPKGFLQACLDGDMSLGEFVDAMVALPRTLARRERRWWRWR